MEPDITNTLNKYKYKIQKIYSDRFERQNGILIDRLGNKYFFKSTSSRNSYAYKSLLQEARITEYLSLLTSKHPIRVYGFRLLTPSFHQLITSSTNITLITKYVSATNMLSYKKQHQYKIIKRLFSLYEELVNKANQYPYNHGKSYSFINMLINSLFNLIKSILNNPIYTHKLLMVFFKILISLKYYKQPFGLVHADINFSNILVKRNVIYLTDWEQSGWGYYQYSFSGPYCVNLSNTLVRRFIKSYYSQQPIFTGLYLPYRILSLFAQKLPSTDVRRIRDTKLLNEICQI